MIKWLNNNNAKKDIKEAKKLFFDFGTSKYQMLREDVLSTYQSYGITPEQEAKWIKELLNFELNQFDTSDLNSIFRLFLSLKIMRMWCI